MTFRKSQRRQGGFSLVELLVAVAVLGIITVYLMETFSVNQEAYQVVDQVSEAQQNMRVVADVLERDMRHAGFMVPTAGAVCAVDNTTSADLLYLSDEGAISPTTSSGSENGSPISGVNIAGSVGSMQNISLDLVIDSDPTYDTNGDGSPDSDFVENAGIIIIDLDNPERGAVCGRVDTVNASAGTIRFEKESGSLGSPTSAGLIAIPANEYRLTTAGVFFRNGLEMTRDTDDFQVALFVDLNDDNVEQVNEMLGDGVGPDYVNTQDLSELRELRVNLVVRTRSEIRDFNEGQFQVFENRTAVAGNDGFRRRAYTSREMLRNLVLRAS